MEPSRKTALYKLAPGCTFSIRDPSGTAEIVNWTDHGTGISQPTEDEIQAKLAELHAAYPLQELREARNALLAESDWTQMPDSALINEKLAEWKLYRQKLRDITSGLDTVDKVNSVIWPTKPI
jgi:hypothetical protein